MGKQANGNSYNYVDKWELTFRDKLFPLFCNRGFLIQKLLYNPGKIYHADDLLDPFEFVYLTVYGRQNIIDDIYFHQAVKRIEELKAFIAEEKSKEVPNFEIQVELQDELKFIKRLLTKTNYNGRPIAFKKDCGNRLYTTFQTLQRSFFDMIKDDKETTDYFRTYIKINCRGCCYTGPELFE